MAWRNFSMIYLLLATPLIAQDDTATQRLTEQSKQFEEQIVQVADNVYTAVGFSVSNVSMIVGEDGLVVVDTGMVGEAAEKIAKEFRKLSDKPVKAIIYTHSHGDHTGGAPAFLGTERPQIWAHKNFGSEARPWKAGGRGLESENTGARDSRGTTCGTETEDLNTILAIFHRMDANQRKKLLTLAKRLLDNSV